MKKKNFEKWIQSNENVRWCTKQCVCKWREWPTNSPWNQTSMSKNNILHFFTFNIEKIRGEKKIFQIIETMLNFLSWRVINLNRQAIGFARASREKYCKNSLDFFLYILGENSNHAVKKSKSSISYVLNHKANVNILLLCLHD